ncbi:MAG: autotransporter-associated beta strand repeat-containing protein [Verrucomicrobiales bacterium]|nr:autotransporter-associated beta strand repeat-containing protein [Verrucomicrobiales bacterium]
MPTQVFSAGSILRIWLLVVGFGLPLTTFAASKTWTGLGATGNWTSPANWQNNDAPDPGDILNFPQNASRKTSNTNNFPSGTAFSTVNIFGADYRLRGNGIVISNYVGIGIPGGTNVIDLDLTAAGPGAGLTLRSFSTDHRLTISGDIELNSRNLTLEGEGDYILTGSIRGSGGIRKLNTGELILSGPVGNTYSGPTLVGAGTLRLSKALLLGFPNPLVSPRTAIPGRLVIGSGSSGPITEFVIHTYSNQIADSSVVEVLGSGELDLEGNNDQIGSLSMRGGSIVTRQARDLGQLTLGGDVDVALGSQPSVIEGQLNLGPNGQRLFDIAQGATLRVDARIVGQPGVSLVKSNRGNLFLTASNLFSGDVELLGGFLTLGHGAALGDVTGVTRIRSGILAIDSTSQGLGIREPLEALGPSGVLRTDSGSYSWLGSVLLEDDLSIEVPTIGSLTILGLISGPAGWVKTGDGTLTFKTGSTNTYSGTSWVQRGNFVMDGVLNQVVVPGPLVVGNHTDPTNTTRAWSIKQHQIADNAPVTVNRSGVLELVVGDERIGSLTFNGGAVNSLNNTLVLGGDILVNATNEMARLYGHLSLGGVSRQINTVGTANTPDLLIEAEILDGGAAAGLSKVGEGSLQLANANLFSGLVTVTDGELRVSHPEALGGASAGTVLSGPDGPRLVLQSVASLTIVAEPLTLDSTSPGLPAVLRNFTGSNQWNGPITLLAPESVIEVPSIPRPLALGGTIGGVGGLTKAGPGVLTLNGNAANTFSGLTKVHEGELILNKPLGEAIPGDLQIGDGLGGANSDRVIVRGSGGAIGNSSRIALSNSGFLILDSVSEAVGSIEGLGNISILGNTSGLVVGGNQLSTVYSGLMTGDGSLEKVGAGVLQFTGGSLLTGKTAISEGALIVDSEMTSSSGVLVNQPLNPANNPPGILGGSGNLPKVVGFPGGTLSPGAGPGQTAVLRVKGDLELSSSDVRIEINGLAPGVGYDVIRVNGGVILGNSSLHLTSAFTATTNDSFLVLQKTSPGPIQGIFLNATEGSIIGTAPDTFRITYQGGDGNDVVLQRVGVAGSTISGISALAGGTMEILGQGQPFATYILEAAPHLDIPIPWTPVATNSANQNGLYQFIDAYLEQGAQLFPKRFYRVISP